MAMAMSMSTLPGVGSRRRLPPVTNMDPTTLATVATRYLEALDLFRSLELDVKWRGSRPTNLGRPAPREGTPDDLFIASIASDLAWSARDFLRAQGLPDDVSVSAEWSRVENPPRLADVSMTVNVSETVQAMSNALEDTLAERVAARSPDERPRLHLRCAGWASFFASDVTGLK